MATGIRTSYTDTNLPKDGLNPIIGMIDWTEAGLLRLLGVNGEKKFRLTAWPRTKYEWLEDTMAPRTTTLGEAVSIGETAIDMAAGTGQYFKEGDILKVEDELMYVSSVSTDTVTVIKGYAGTTDAAHDTGLTVTLATSARLEGADFDTGYTTTVSRPYNYTQILAEAVMVTGSEQEEEKWGVNSTMDYHIAKLIGGAGIGPKNQAGKLAILLEQTFYHGQRAAGSASTSRSMGGFEAFVTTNKTNAASGALTRTMIENLQETCYLAGGNPNMLIVNTWAWRKINSFYEGYIRTDRSETEGGHVIKTLTTVLGDIEVMFTRWCPTNRAYLIEKEKMGWCTYRPFDIYDRASTGDYEVKDVLGEFGFILMNEKSHGYIYNISTSA